MAIREKEASWGVSLWNSTLKVWGIGNQLLDPGTGRELRML